MLILITSCQKYDTLNVSGKIKVELSFTTTYISAFTNSILVYSINNTNEAIDWITLGKNLSPNGIQLTSNAIIYGTYKIDIYTSYISGGETFYYHSTNTVQVLPDQVTTVTIKY